MQNELNNILNKLRDMPDKMYMAQMQVVIKSNLLREQDLDIRTYQRKQIQAIAEEKTVEGKKKFSNQQARDAELEFRTLQDKNKIMQDIRNRGGPLAYLTIIIDDKTLLTGASPDKLKEVLEIWQH